MPSPQKPECRSCWFAKQKDRKVGDGIYCLREPLAVKKDHDDFCMHHPAWLEYEASREGEAISELYERE